MAGRFFGSVAVVVGGLLGGVGLLDGDRGIDVRFADLVRKVKKPATRPAMSPRMRMLRAVMMVRSGMTDKPALDMSAGYQGMNVSGRGNP